MPTVFSPPSVSALKTRVARYFSGSRAALVGVGDAAGLANVIGELLALVARLVFVLVSDRWQALRAKQSRLISSREVKPNGVENLEGGAVQTVLREAVFISFSEELEPGLVK
jgi:hypothetical protein